MMHIFLLELKNQWPNIKTVKVIFLTNKPLSKRYEHSERGELFGKRVAVGIWDLQRFFEVESSGGEREQILVVLKILLGCTGAANQMILILL